jgi:acetoin utilization protein AcuB
MYVKSRMTANPFTIKANDPLTEIIDLMREKKLKRVPVVSEDGKSVVGIVTEGDIQKVSPSEASTLSIFEMNYLLRKMMVSSAMTKNPITINQDALLEDAALLMRGNKISTLPVVDNEDNLVGIITESDIFDAFLDLMGFRMLGTRLTIRAQNVPGVLAEVTKIFHTFGFNISHIAVYGGGAVVCDVVIRFNAFNIDELTKAIEEKGYEIVHVLRSQEELD